MKLKHYIASLLLIIFLVPTSNAYAFDNERKGFILGIGIGPSFTSYKQKLSVNSQTAESDRQNSFGFASDIKIGYAPNNNLMVYYTNKATWFSMQNVYGDNVTIVNGVSSLGVSYYLNPTGPSIYLSGTIGMSSWSAAFEDNSDSWSGFGLGAGIGYEFKPHWSVEGNIIWGKPGKKVNGVEVYSNALGVLFTVNNTLY